MQSPSERGLVRALGVRSLAAGIVNMTIGAGIFVLPVFVATGLGPAAPVAYVVCGGLMALIVACFAAAGSRVSMTGGLYAYIGVAFGPFLGLLAGVLYQLMAAFAAASVASAFAGSVGALWTPIASLPGRAALLIGLFAVLAAVNVRGVTFGARLVETVTVAKLLPLVVLVGAGLWFVNPAYVRLPAWPAPSAVGRTAIVLIFAFLGVEVALVPSGEVRDPARTVPRAIFLALAITTTLYLLIQRVAQGLLGPSIADFASAPLAEAASRVLGASGRTLVASGAIVSMFGYVAGAMLSSPRSLYAFGRDGVLPAALARVHSRFHTPHVAIITYAILIAALAISSSFAQLAVLANVAALALYLIGIAAAYELQRRDVRADGPPFHLPGGPAIPLLAGGVILWLLSNATIRELAVALGVVAVASLFYVVRKNA